MFRFLVLIGMGIAGYMVARRLLAPSGGVPDAEDLYGSAEIHRAADQPSMS